MPDHSFRPQIMLPQEHIGWIAKQTDEVLSIWKFRDLRNGLKYRSIANDPKSTLAFTEKIIHRCLTR